MRVITEDIDTDEHPIANDGERYESIIVVDVDMRECELGESTIGINCVVCDPEEYSLDPESNVCSECPSEAICYGNYTMVPRSGYWRTSLYTDNFHECPNPDACIGSPTPPNALSYTGDCAEGYVGNMCQACDSGYSRSARNV